MQSVCLSFSTFLFLSLLSFWSFHGGLVNGQVFNFPTNKITLSGSQNGGLDPSGSYITLNSSTGVAQAFYSAPITLWGQTSRDVLSFASFFTFESTATSGNGTIAFVLAPEATGGLTEARKTLTVEFNTSCSSTGFGGGFYGGHGFGGRGHGWGGPGFGGFGGGFLVAEYANGTSIGMLNKSGYGPAWNGVFPQNGPYFCSQQPPQDILNPIFQYQVVVEYNASTDSLWVGSPSCGANLALTTEFQPQNLSGIITAPVYAGFVVSGGGIFNITQWNFTTNVNTSSVLSLAVSASTTTTVSGSSSDGSASGGMGHSDGRKLKKGYVIAFSILGAAIGVAAVLLVCCLCMMRRKRVTSAGFVAKGTRAGTIPESAVVFDAKKPPAPPAKVVLVERDTTPLNTHPNSAFHASTEAASWLKPVAPR